MEKWKKQKKSQKIPISLLVVIPLYWFSTLTDCVTYRFTASAVTS